MPPPMDSVRSDGIRAESHDMIDMTTDQRVQSEMSLISNQPQLSRKVNT